MIKFIKDIWNRLFLEERPSINFSLFRIVVALTVGAVVIPTLFNLADNYYHTALKIYNLTFFPFWFVDLVQKSPDSVVLFFVIAFCVFWLFFLVGLFSRISCILMTLCCYYFYALNSFHVGTLSWDILLVTLFLMCITPYHGDYFSLDCLRRSDTNAYKKVRPFFLQRLLQLQIACTFFYTGLYKISLQSQGNWFTDNPIYYLMNRPPEGSVKWFLLKDFFMDKPQLCFWVGVSIVVIELLMPFLLFIRQTRLSAIVLGIFFHIVLILTLDVPATFFFLFPAQLLLFIHPDKTLYWIEQKRKINQQTTRSQLIFDGHCQFCIRSIQQLKTMDLFDTLEAVDYQETADVKSLHLGLTKELCASQLHLVEPDGKLYGGYHVFRRLCWSMPMLYFFIPILYFPGSGVIGPLVYRWIAKNRYFFHSNKTCKNNTCFR